MSKKEVKVGLKTFRYEEYQNKIEEGADNVGFNSFKRNNVVSDYEEETSIDDEGEGKVLNIDKDVDVSIEDEPTVTEPNNDAIDVGESDINGKDLLNKISELSSLVKNQEIKLQDMGNIYQDIQIILKKYPVE